MDGVSEFWGWETLLWKFFAENSPGKSWEEVAIDAEWWELYVEQVM